MPRSIMVVYSEPVEPGREEEYRSWYDGHIRQALEAVPGMARAVRYRLSQHQRHPSETPCRYMTIYEIDTDDPEALHERLLAAWQDGKLPESDVIRGGPIIYWDFDSEVVAGDH